MPKKKIEISKNIKFIPTSKLVPYEKNARTHSPEQVSQIAASILEFGFTNPVLIDAKFGVIAGHGRLEAAKSLGLSDVPVIVLDHLTELQKRAYILADNKLALNAGWDEEVLAEELAALLAADYNIDTIGFSEKDLRDILPDDTQEETDAADALPNMATNELKVCLGDIYELGEHRLMCGDSTDLKQVEFLMDGKLADLWIADPPFGVSYVEKNAAVCGGIVKNAVGKEIKSDTLSVEELKPFWKKAAEAAYAYTTDKASNYWCACQGSDKMMMMMMMMDEAGWNIRHELIWVKQQFVFGRSDYHYRHEPIIYGWKKKGKHVFYGDRKQDSVFEIDRPHKSDMHPTTKPVELFSAFILNSTKKGEIVLESFGGSGTTLIACEKANRVSNTMELDPHYCSVIIKRWENFTGKKAKKIFPVKTILKKKK